MKNEIENTIDNNKSLFFHLISKSESKNLKYDILNWEYNTNTYEHKFERSVRNGFIIDIIDNPRYKTYCVVLDFNFKNIYHTQLYNELPLLERVGLTGKLVPLNGFHNHYWVDYYDRIMQVIENPDSLHDYPYLKSDSRKQAKLDWQRSSKAVSAMLESLPDFEHFDQLWDD
ncbi:MAG: hypothetical protein WC307_03390 [Candidatus Nanoarchaeia archaeon]|jgi:hypothetical protein